MKKLHRILRQHPVLLMIRHILELTSMVRRELGQSVSVCESPKTT